MAGKMRSTNVPLIDAARKYVDAGRVGRGRAPRGPESKHSEMRYKAIAGRSGSAPYQRRQINIFHCRSNRLISFRVDFSRFLQVSNIGKRRNRFFGNWVAD